MTGTCFKLDNWRVFHTALCVMCFIMLTMRRLRLVRTAVRSAKCASENIVMALNNVMIESVTPNTIFNVPHSPRCLSSDIGACIQASSLLSGAVFTGLSLHGGCLPGRAGGQRAGRRKAKTPKLLAAGSVVP
jgi:hypothetical protein